jgi:outer membrane protein assembly factor BamD
MINIKIKNLILQFLINMKKTQIILILFAIIQFGCNKETFQKILKNDDYELKYQKAKLYYEEEKYQKALQLYEQLIPYEKGKERGEEVLYYYSMCNYNLKDFILAGYYFRYFSNTYPNSEFNEECLYLSAYCYYLDSPKPTLDQTPTEEAILAFELFLSLYPNSNKLDTCNILIDDLRFKLQEKSYNNSKIYYDLGYYNAASLALENSLADYPDSPFKEELLYYQIKTNYDYASNSIESKQEERYQKAIKKYKSYIKYFPTGKYIKEVEKINADCQEKIINLSS